MEIPLVNYKSNSKMQLAVNTLGLAILQFFPENYIETTFSGMLQIGDVVEMIMIDSIRDAYDKVSPKRSLRQHLYDVGVDYEDDRKKIMKYSRMMAYLMDQRQREYDRRADYHGLYPEMDQLIPPDMMDMKTRTEGYQLTDMQFFEVNTIMETDFTKAVTEHRLVDSKKISNDRFIDIMGQYDIIIDRLNKDWDKDDESTVFNTIAAFVLEWKYPVHFLYSLAKRMEELNISNFADEQLRLVTFCADVSGTSHLGNEFSTHSRMITVRDRYIDLILKESSDSEIYGIEHCFWGEGLNIVCQMRRNLAPMNGEPIVEWLIENTTVSDWASFCRDYDIFGIINAEKKEWTDKRIKYFRKLYDRILIKPEGGEASA